MANKNINLPYSDNEILILYKDAADKESQIKILAELNVCDEETIQKVLIRAGLDISELPSIHKENKNDTKSISCFIEDSEILTLYENAVDKRAHLKILAESYNCDEETIRKSLIHAGLDGRKLPRKLRKNIDNEYISKKENTNITVNNLNKNTENENAKISVVVKRVILELEIKKLENQLEYLKSELSKYN